MNMIFKRSIAAFSLTVFCVSMLTVVPAAAEARRYANVTIKSKVDLSDSEYFPEIGNQGSINSCTAWASTYYQFTYEANMLNGITTTPQNTYSPTWTYNLTNNGINTFVTISSAYNVLYTHGALRMEDCPYNSENYDYSWSTDTEAMIDALNTRILDYYDNKITIVPTNTAKIDSPSDELLTEVKQYLCAGKVLTVSVNYSGTTENGAENWSTKQTTSGEWAVYQAESEGGGHAMTVVGYNDNIVCDINDDNIIEPSERGAFKLANSYGKDWANEGFIWVMYDALNVESAHPKNNWVSDDRIPIFDGIGDGKNTFRYIDVVKHNPNLVGLLTFTTNYRYNTELYTNRNTTATYPTANQYKACAWSSGRHVTPYTGTIAVDYGTLDDNIEDYLVGHNWFIKVQNQTSAGNITNVSYKIVDNMGVEIKNFGTIANSIAYGNPVTASRTLNLLYGDVDYSTTINSGDTSFIMAYIVKSIEFSNLQKILADYNHDGAVDIFDIIAINNSMPAAESAKFSAYIAEEYNRIASSPTKASTDMTAEQAQAYAELVTALYEQIVLK